jgi:integrase/recombinase XerD
LGPATIGLFALVAMLGLLRLRIFEACGADIEDLSEEHGHRDLKVPGKGGNVVLAPLPPAAERVPRDLLDRSAAQVQQTRGVRYRIDLNIAGVAYA